MGNKITSGIKMPDCHLKNHYAVYNVHCNKCTRPSWKVCCTCANINDKYRHRLRDFECKCGSKANIDEALKRYRLAKTKSNG